MAQDPLRPTRCAELLSALAAPERLRIVRFLGTGPQTVTAIAEMLDVPAVNVSHHLNVLRHAKLITGKKQGRFVFYSLSSGVLEELSQTEQGKEAINLGCCQLVIPAPPRSRSEV